MAKTVSLNEDINQKIIERQLKFDELLSPYACFDKDIIRKSGDYYATIRRGFRRDVEAVINLKQFNRYANKTQVFSLHKNNDISNRSYHAQLVSKVARTIGEALGLNVHLIEAIALSHDLGHTPFGHIGEKYLGELTAKYGYNFQHHIQSARYLYHIAGRNISYQVIDGALGHNGEVLLREYIPCESPEEDAFEFLDKKLDECYIARPKDTTLVPCTLEGCLVRICDVIAYLGKDRQDAEKLGLKKIKDVNFSSTALGERNRDFISNISNDIINNSFGQNKICLSEDIYSAMRIVMEENYKKIYLTDEVKAQHAIIKVMFSQIFEFLYNDLTLHKGQLMDELYFSFIDYPPRKASYVAENPPERLVADFMASMCDDYFVAFYQKFRAKNPDWCEELHYIDYFD